jgi:hypothetical protein
MERKSSDFQKIHEFLMPYEKIWQNEVMESYPHFDHYYEEEWVNELMELSEDELYKFEGCHDYSVIKGESFRDFLNKIIELSAINPLLPINLMEKNLQELAKEKFQKHTFVGMKPKKVHEITSICQFLSEYSHVVGSAEKIFDWGGGKGLLANTLSEVFDKKVMSFDANISLQEMGKIKADKNSLKLKVPVERTKNVELIHIYINDSGEVFDQLKFYYSEQTNLTVGLHCCGSLSLNQIKFFSTLPLKTSRNYLLNFGCCYYKIKSSDAFLSQKALKLKSYLTSEALTLATRAHGSYTEKEFSFRYKVKFFRFGIYHFLYQNLPHLKSRALGFTEGKFYHGRFQDYVYEQFKKFNFSDQESLMNAELAAQDFSKTSTQLTIKRMFVCGIIRGLFGRLLEKYYLLDKVIFLEENQCQSQLGILFDENLSPRNIGIWALKA